MKKITPIILSLLILCTSTGFTEEEKKAPMITMGITGMGGTNEIRVKKTEQDFETGFIWGGGLLLEKMMFRHLGASTGVQYRFFKNNYEDIDTATSEKYRVHWEFNAISVPLHLVTSIQGPSSSINLLIGATYTHIYSSTMSRTFNSTTETSDDAMKLINASQVAVSGGVIFRFLITRYTDFFMGVMAEYYPANILDISEGAGKIRMLNYSFNTGYMFRTNLF